MKKYLTLLLKILGLVGLAFCVGAGAKLTEDVDLYVAAITAFSPPEGKYYLVDDKLKRPRDLSTEASSSFEKIPESLVTGLIGLSYEDNERVPALPKQSYFLLLSDSEKQRLNWGSPEAVKAIETYHPNSFGSLHFSKPFFSPDHSKALIYREFYVNDHGDGGIYFFQRVEGKWKLIEGMHLWRASW